MTANWLHAAAALADVLARENAALQRLDFPAAVALVADKEAALANLAAHDEEMQQQPPPAEAVTLGRHLNALAAENRASSASLLAPPDHRSHDPTRRTVSTANHAAPPQWPSPPGPKHGHLTAAKTLAEHQDSAYQHAALGLATLA
jgi:hypothetical protein